MSNWFFSKAGIAITIQCTNDDAEKLVTHTLSGLNLTLNDELAEIVLSVNQKDGEWHLYDHKSDRAWSYVGAGDLIYMLSDRIVFYVADKTEQAHCLHAAAVAHENKAVLIPAKSGSGKSTFTCWMVQSGFSYVTDELILLDQDKQLQAIARPIQIKPHGIDAIQPLLRSEIKYKGKLANAITPDLLGGDVCLQENLTAGLFIFPEYDKEAGFEFKRLSMAEAGMNLMSNHVNARNLEGHGFREMMGLIRQIPAYSLNYSGFDSLPDDFADQVKSLL